MTNPKEPTTRQWLEAFGLAAIGLAVLYGVCRGLEVLGWVIWD